MKNSSIPSKVLSTAIFSIVLYLLLWFLNFGFSWLVDTFLFPLLNWFNHLSIILKAIILALGGSILIYLILTPVALLVGFIKDGLLLILKVKKAIIIISWILCSLNAILMLIELWSSFIGGFWQVVELLLMSFLVLQINYVLTVQQSEVDYIKEGMETT
jgi:hypothetical protein